MITTNRPLRVFLCHSSNDKPAVRELYKKLLAEVWIQPWLDEEELYPGQDWNQEIEKAIEATDVIIVCLSNNSITKEGYVQREIRIALDYADYKPEGTLFIIPIRLEECTPPKRLSRWQYADYLKGRRKKAFERLLISLKERNDSLGLKIKKDIQPPASKDKLVDPREKKKKTVRMKASKGFAGEIEVHLFTAGSGGSGKTTLMLNALSYFTKKDDEVQAIVILDEGDNTDFSALWLNYLVFRENRATQSHGRFQLNTEITKPSIIAFEPLPTFSRGLRWTSLNKIIESMSADLVEKDKKVVVLVDTGGSLGPLIRNSGNLKTLNRQFYWRFIPWIIWTPNSLTNEAFITSNQFAVKSLAKNAQSALGERFVLMPLHVFNPILPLESRTLFSIVSSNIIIESLRSYNKLPANKSLDIDEFVRRVKSYFVSQRILDLEISRSEIYSVIGKILNKGFTMKENDKHQRYANILAVYSYDVRLAQIKQAPGLTKRLLEDLKVKAVENNTYPAKFLNSVFGDIYEAVANGLDVFFDSASRQNLT